MHLVKHLFTLVLVTIILQGCSALVDPTDRLLENATRLENAGKYKEAEDIYREAYKVNSKASPMQVVILLNEARFLLRTRNYQKAIGTCKKGLEVCQSVYGPEDMLNASFIFVLALTYDELEDYEKAKTNYKTIMTMSPFSRCRRNVVVLMPLIKRGDIAFKQHNLTEALALYRKAYVACGSQDPISRLIFYRLALASWSFGQNNDAEFYFKQALPYLANQAGPQNIYLLFASFLTKTGRFGSASFATNMSDLWLARRREYLNWYFSRSLSVLSAPRLLDIYTEQDYNLVDAIEKGSATEGLSVEKKAL